MLHYVNGGVGVAGKGSQGLDDKMHITIDVPLIQPNITQGQLTEQPILK